MTKLISKVPELTLFFWIIKVLSTTVGETGADYLAVNLNWGLVSTTYWTGVILILSLITQLRITKYIASSYWFVVIMMSIVGTLITDILVDNYGISLITLSILFIISIIIVFFIWYKKEKSLSIHSIHTLPRESFYWLVILIAFALGTAVGDFLSESLALGYSLSLGVFIGLIIFVSILYYLKTINSVVAFWLAFILTRPVGASLGDLLIQLPEDGGIGINAAAVNIIFFIIIISLIGYLSVSKVDIKKIKDK